MAYVIATGNLPHRLTGVAPLHGRGDATPWSEPLRGIAMREVLTVEHLRDAENEHLVVELRLPPNPNYFRPGHLTLCSCKACQVGPDHEVMKGPDHVEIGEAEGIVGVHDGCRDELRAGWRIATEQR